LKIEMWDIDKVIPYDNNPRFLQETLISAVAESIDRFGMRRAIVVDKDSIIVAGHARLAAAKKLGMKKVPVHVASELTPEQIKAYRLVDNRSAEFARWDPFGLQREIDSLNLQEDLEVMRLWEDEQPRWYVSIGSKIRFEKLDEIVSWVWAFDKEYPSMEDAEAELKRRMFRSLVNEEATA